MRRSSPESESVDTPTAQECFKRMVKEFVGPGLRSHGLKGSGVRFSWPSSSYNAGLHLQKSVHSSADEVLFRVEMSVSIPSLFEEIRRLTELAKQFKDAFVLDEGGNWSSELWSLCLREHRIGGEYSGVGPPRLTSMS